MTDSKQGVGNPPTQPHNDTELALLTRMGIKRLDEPQRVRDANLPLVAKIAACRTRIDTIPDAWLMGAMQSGMTLPEAVAHWQEQGRLAKELEGRG